MINNLNKHPYSQCYYIQNNDGIVFISYRTPVIVVDAEGWLVCRGTYSAATRRQIGWFMQEMHFGSYQLAKSFMRMA